MRLLKLKTLAMALILAMPGANAAPLVGVMTLALNCPDRNTDPKCPNHVSQAQQQAQQQEQQRAKLQAQQQDQLRAKQLSSQQDQQRAKLQAQQQDQLRAKQMSSLQDQQRAKLQAAQQDQLRAQQLSSQQGHLRDNAQAPLDGRRLAADGRRSTPASPVAVGAATHVIPRGDPKSFDIRHKSPDGSQILISQKQLPDGTRKMTGFKQTEDSRNGTTTRIYSDGRSVTQGRDFERRKVGNGMDFVTNRNGLREAQLPDGRPVFKDRFISTRERDGREHQIIERTEYAHWANGRREHEERPRVHHYDVGRIHGEPVAEYRPSRFAPEEYRRYHSRFAVPVAVAAVALMAAGAYVAFDSPAASYNDPAALMGDMMISSGFEEGYAESIPDSAASVYDAPEAVALRSQMVVVQQQVNTSVQGDASLKDQLGGVDLQASSSQVQQAVGNAVPVQISEEVREQVRQQVRLSVAMHQNGHPLVLASVLASGYAKIYLFQTAQPLNVEGVSTGACFLNTGDLIGFSTLPAAESPVAEMKVIASGANSCRPGELVQIRLTDLQEMLNGFSERVEDNMNRVSACAASGRC